MKTEFYRGIVDDYDQMTGAPARLARELPAILEGLRACGAHRVLDVGCATGQLALALAKEGFEVVAIDPEPGFITRLRRTPALPANLSALEGSLDQWAARSEKPVDAMLCLGHTFPHLVALRPLDNVLAILAHVIVPGGAAILQMLNPAVVERLKVWTPPVRRWSDAGADSFVVRQWVDSGDSMQMVLTRVRASGGVATASTWEQHLPKVRATELAQSFTGAGWEEVTLAADWSGARFDEENSESFLITVRAPRK